MTVNNDKSLFIDTNITDLLDSLTWLGRNVRAETIYISRINCKAAFVLLANFLLDPSGAKQCASKIMKIDVSDPVVFFNSLIEKFYTIPLVERSIPTIGFDYSRHHGLPAYLGPNLIDQAFDSEHADALYLILNGQNRMLQNVAGTKALDEYISSQKETYGADKKLMDEITRLSKIRYASAAEDYAVALQKQFEQSSIADAKCKADIKVYEDNDEDQFNKFKVEYGKKIETIFSQIPMRRSARLAEKQAKPDNEAQMELNAKKNRTCNKISKIAAMDNVIMVEAFKYLNYCQLANSSFVSKRFWDVIQTHRHSLSRLYIYQITMKLDVNVPAYIKVFNKALSPKSYNEWVICNQYSKQVALEGQVAGAERPQYERKLQVELWADANYIDTNHSYETKNVFSACVKLNCENWPVFQHFVRLLADPFIYIHFLNLIPQIEVLNLLAESLISENLISHNRLQCNVLIINLRDNMQNFIKWIKDHMRCNKFRINLYSNSKYDDEFLDLFMTGANCTSEININCFNTSKCYSVKDYDMCKVVIDFVQKFMDLKSCDENQMIEFIRGNFFSRAVVETLKRKYAEFVVEGENENRSTECILEFVNNRIGKKLQLTQQRSLKVANL